MISDSMLQCKQQKVIKVIKKPGSHLSSVVRNSFNNSLGLYTGFHQCKKTCFPECLNGHKCWARIVVLWTPSIDQDSDFQPLLMSPSQLMDVVTIFQNSTTPLLFTMRMCFAGHSCDLNSPTSQNQTIQWNQKTYFRMEKGWNYLSCPLIES